MIIGIIGLGLIGGSLALATKKYTNHTVLGMDINEGSILEAKNRGAIDGQLSDDKICLCDLIFVAVTPKLACEYFEKIAGRMKSDAILSDITGVKKDVYSNLLKLSKRYPLLNFISTHPMAGREVGGMVSALENLFSNSYIIIVDIKSSEFAKKTICDLYLSLGAKENVFADWEQHDSMIAYTSQLAHIVSASYIKNDLSKTHKGFSAGSFLDMTRVAKLNPKMWTELCMENRTNLSVQIEKLILELRKFDDALVSENSEKLYDLFDEALQSKLLSEKEH